MDIVASASALGVNLKTGYPLANIGIYKVCGHHQPGYSPSEMLRILDYITEHTLSETIVP